MKRVIAITGTLLIGFSLSIISIPITANAVSWHSSSIPSKLRGYWYAAENSNQGVHIYKHSIHYKGEKTVKVKWRYAGNGSYRFKSANSYGDIIHPKYYGAHKITMNSYWHSYRR